jgi:hypothetical protein
VEVDVVMQADTPLWKAHDLSQQLQDKIEVLPNVERAFVHVDHETTHYPVCAWSLTLAWSTILIFAISGTSKDTLDDDACIDTQVFLVDDFSSHIGVYFLIAHAVGRIQRC